MSKYTLFSAQMKMADIVYHNYLLIPVLGRFGIKYGFRNRTVEEVCRQYNINTWFFLEIVNAYHNRDYFPTEKLRDFSFSDIIAYLVNTHRYFQKVKIPEIQVFIDKLMNSAPEENSKNIKLLDDFFKKYVEEIDLHFSHEEEDVFPYIEQIGQAIDSGNVAEELIERIINEPIEEYERQHDNLEIKLNDLKNLIIKYLPPHDNVELVQKLLTELFRVEIDLNDHSRIEEKVLVPKVKSFEQSILKKSGVSN
ncbi:hemerythrin domain-containing protein [Maribellus maritimus]|uniref:hemerythrin domain-containing protein n=1 Tax=Maribellus maritimus TaxID=2870838 RepID=UPI001EEA4A97|nr:hemerythrin domain-containing protein [Maribellus maritimus]MCG6186274.1 hemerythrin domain-containing protein [Maribellus maritimus]